MDLGLVTEDALDLPNNIPNDIMPVPTLDLPQGLPTLAELKHMNGPHLHPETAWIWGEDDEAS